MSKRGQASAAAADDDVDDEGDNNDSLSRSHIHLKTHTHTGDEGGAPTYSVTVRAAGWVDGEVWVEVMVVDGWKRGGPWARVWRRDGAAGPGPGTSEAACTPASADFRQKDKRHLKHHGWLAALSLTHAASEKGMNTETNVSERLQPAERWRGLLP